MPWVRARGLQAAANTRHNASSFTKPQLEFLAHVWASKTIQHTLSRWLSAARHLVAAVRRCRGVRMILLENREIVLRSSFRTATGGDGVGMNAPKKGSADEEWNRRLRPERIRRRQRRFAGSRQVRVISAKPILGRQFYRRPDLGSVSPELGIAPSLPVPRLVSRRKVRHLGALESAMRSRAGRLVCPRHVHSGQFSVQLPRQNLRPPLAIRVQRHLSYLAGGELESRGTDSALCQDRGQVFRRARQSPWTTSIAGTRNISLGTA